MGKLKNPFVLMEERHTFDPRRYYFCELHNRMASLGECQMCPSILQEYKGTIVCDYQE